MEEIQQTEKNEKPKKNKVVTILSNVLYGIVMVILIVFLGYSMGSVSQNKVPSFFGKSYVRILTGSMKASGFDEGEVVMIKRVKLSEIKVGDIVAFYWGPPRRGSAPSFSQDATLKEDVETGQKSFDNSIVFHQVAEVGIDTYGNLWIKTFGTSNKLANGEPDYDGWTKGDHIVGVYEENIFAGVIQFISSPAGIIAIVIVPCCIVLFMLLMKIIDIIDKMAQEKKKNQKENLEKINEINGVDGNSEKQQAEIEEVDQKQDNEKQLEEIETGNEQLSDNKQQKQQSEEISEQETDKINKSNKQNADEKSKQKKTIKRSRKKFNKGEKEQILKQVDELVEMTKNANKKTEEGQDV